MGKTKERGGHVSVRLTEEECAAAEDLYLGDGGEEVGGIAMSMRSESLYVGSLSSEWSLTGLIAWLQELLAVVPEEYRESAVVEFDSDYDSSLVDVVVEYLRPPTTEEVEAERSHKLEMEARHEREIRTNAAYWGAALKRLEEK